MATLTPTTSSSPTPPPSQDIEKEYSNSILVAWLPPKYRTRERLLLLKLDLLLLPYAFIAGLNKDMDQSATTAAYVSGMREALSL